MTWDDLRIFLACVDRGSFRGAAEALKVNSATVMRRIDRLESALGVRMFNRLQGGAELTEDGQRILDQARTMERASFDVFRRAKYLHPQARGTVRVCVTEGLGTYWVMPKLVEFQGSHPLLTVELVCRMELANIRRLESDISIQFVAPDEPELIATRLGRLHVYPFASKGYVRKYGLPASPADVKKHRIVQQVAPQLDEGAYARELGLESVEDVVGIRTNASSALLYAVERGAGIGMLPTYARALEANVVPVDIGIKHHMDMWLVYHPDLKTSMRHTVVIKWLRQIFDPKRYPCFGDEFIHPSGLVSLMRPVSAAMSGKGYAAVDPIGRGEKTR